MNTGRLSYGGKVGVWISHKRNKRAVKHRNAVMKNQSALSQYNHHSMIFRRAASQISYTGGCKDPLLGWDEVKCRPVYYNTSHEEIERSHDEHQENEEVRNENDEKQHDVLSWETSKVKKSYGGQMTKRHRRGRLSSLANSVLENVASPIVPSFSGKKNSSPQSISPTILNVDDDSDDNHHGEHNLNDFSMLAVHEHDTLSDDDCNANDTLMTSELQQFEFSNESTSHHGANSKLGKRKMIIQSKKEQEDSSLKLSKKVKGKKYNKNKNQATSTVRQPSYSSSLEEAKAFFDQLDREELKIVSCEE